MSDFNEHTMDEKIGVSHGKPRLRRLLLTIAWSLVALLLFVQVNQRLARHNAEALYADLLLLQMHSGTFADLQRLERRWGAHARFEGECTAAHCNYLIVSDAPGDALLIKLGIFSHPRLYAVYSYLGGREAFVVAEVCLHRNVIWRVTYEAHVDAGDRGERAYPLIGRLDAGPHLMARYPDLTTAALRKGFRMGQPGACTGCVKGWTYVTFQTPPEEVRRLFRIDFDCWTRWQPCEQQADLMPNWRSIWDRNDDVQVCPPVLARAREAAFIVLAQIKAVTPDKQADETYTAVTARLRQVKSQVPVPLPAEVRFSVKSGPPVEKIEAGKRYFFLYSQPFAGERQDVFESSPCSVIPYSEASERTVRDGAALDWSQGTLYEYRQLSYP